MRMPTSPSDMTDEPAIDSGGGLVRLRLDIAYDGTEFAGWAAQADQRTVAGVIDDALSTVFRIPVRCGRPGAPTPACTRRVRSRTSTFRPMRSARLPAHRPARGRTRVPAVGAPAVAVLAIRCQGERHRPRASGFRRTVLGAAAALRVPALHGAARCRAARCAVCDPVAALVGHRRDGRRITRTGRTPRLRGVLPSPRRCHHDPGPATVGLVEGRRSRHGLRQRRRVLLVDGALPGRRAVGGRGGTARTSLVRRAC